MPRLEPRGISQRRFDYIIIGGGTAGCVLANRLSAKKQSTVLVLEAGSNTQEDLLNVQIPLFNSKLKNTDVDWQFESTPQIKADNRKIGVPQGRLLGGSSAFNACILHRCSPSDYDAWNIDGWYYKDLAAYFKKAETYHDDEAAVDESIHGKEGPLNVTRINKETALGSHFKKACHNYGLKEYRDMTNMPCQIGVTGMEATIYQGQRSSVGFSYLPTAIQNNRANLCVGLGCKVSRIVMDGNKVTGVEFLSPENEVYTVFVDQEIILSAGAIISPSLLLISGIGPRSELEALGIDVKADLPGVGKNLQNHWRVPLVHETTEPQMSLHHDIFEKAEKSLKQALDTKDGALTGVWPDAVAYMKIPDAPDNSSSVENTPQIELFTGGLALCRQLPQLKNIDCATVLMVYVAPFSKGTVTLTIEKDICVNVALLEDERDLECLEKGLLLSMKIADDCEYKNNCVKRWIMHPVLDSVGIRQYIKENVDTLHHYAGTCKMGPKEDSFAVVDSNLKVHGISGLRVVDASFFPIVPAGQICFPVIACAERASDLILSDNK